MKVCEKCITADREEFDEQEVSVEKERLIDLESGLGFLVTILD